MMKSYQLHCQGLAGVGGSQAVFTSLLLTWATACSMSDSIDMKGQSIGESSRSPTKRFAARRSVTIQFWLPWFTLAMPMLKSVCSHTPEATNSA